VHANHCPAIVSRRQDGPSAVNMKTSSSARGPIASYEQKVRTPRFESTVTARLQPACPTPSQERQAGKADDACVQSTA